MWGFWGTGSNWVAGYKNCLGLCGPAGGLGSGSGHVPCACSARWGAACVLVAGVEVVAFWQFGFFGQLEKCRFQVWGLLGLLPFSVLGDEFLAWGLLDGVGGVGPWRLGLFT